MVLPWDLVLIICGQARVENKSGYSSKCPRDAGSCCQLPGWLACSWAAQGPPCSEAGGPATLSRGSAAAPRSPVGLRSHEQPWTLPSLSWFRRWENKHPCALPPPPWLKSFSKFYFLTIISLCFFDPLDFTSSY